MVHFGDCGSTKRSFCFEPIISRGTGTSYMGLSVVALGILMFETRWSLLCSVMYEVFAITTWSKSRRGWFFLAGRYSLSVVESHDSALAA